MMVMHPLCSTVPSEPSTRRKRSKGTVGPLPRPPRSNSTAPAPPADVISVATGTKSVLVQTPSAASTARVTVKVVFGAASWMLTLTRASKSPFPALVGETMTRPVPCPVTAVRAFMAPVGPACAAGAAIKAAQAANRPTASERKPRIRIMPWAMLDRRNARWIDPESLLENSGGCWLGSGGLAGEAAGHDDDHGPVDIGLVVGGQPFVVPHGAPVTSDPRQGALHHPPAGQDLECMQVIGPFHDFLASGAAGSWPR